jgi:putative endonuclease
MYPLAEVAELVDALDSKSSLAQTEWGFESPLRHMGVQVYVLQSLEDQKFYTGITENLEARLKKHQQGGVPSTKNRRPLVLLYTEEFENYSLARKREKYFKSGPGHKELLRILETQRVPASSG